MALYYDLPVYQDVYRLILKLFELTREFPREYKYTLGLDRVLGTILGRALAVSRIVCPGGTFGIINTAVRKLFVAFCVCRLPKPDHTERRGSEGNPYWE